MKLDQRRVFWPLWGGYFALYLCRLNLAASLPALIRDNNLTGTQAGWIGSCFFACYGLGQIVNGCHADRWGPRRMLTLGLLGSAAANLAFGLSPALPLFVFCWSINGLFQSMGWPACMRAMADWFPPEGRGRVFGLFATSYHAGTIAALLLAAWLCEQLSWRAAFLVPSAILVGAAALFHASFRDRPGESVGVWECGGVGESGRPELSDDAAAHAPSHTPTPPHPRTPTLLHPRLILVGLAISAMSVVGYGFLFWAPTYLAETRHLSPLGASSQSLFLALAGAASVAFTGWATDALFHGRRMPLLVMMCLACAVLVFLFPRVPLEAPWQMVAYLSAVGFFAFGPHGLLVGAVAIDLVPREMAGRAAGVLDAFGYAGAFVTGAGTGWLAQHHGWPAVFPVWAGSVLLCAALCAALGRDRR